MNKPLLLAVNAVNFTLISVAGINITANQIIDVVIYLLCAIFSRVLADKASVKLAKVKTFASDKAFRLFQIVVDLIPKAIENGRKNLFKHKNRQERRSSK